MKIILTTPTFDPAGYIEIEVDPIQSTFQRFERRVAKTPTLDGGVVIEDRGFVHGDRELRFFMPTPRDTLVESLRRIVESYSRVNISFEEGLFTCSPGPFTFTPEQAILLFSVETKVA